MATPDRWEIKIGKGKKRVYEASHAAKLIKQHLERGDVKLSSPCRRRPQGEGGKINNAEWRPLRECARDEFKLRILYEPKQAYGMRFARRGAALGWICAAIWWIRFGLSAASAGVLSSISSSIVIIAALFLSLLAGPIMGLLGYGLGYMIGARRQPVIVE